MLTLPSEKRLRCPHVTFSEIDRLSSCASDDINVSSQLSVEKQLSVPSIGINCIVELIRPCVAGAISSLELHAVRLKKRSGFLVVPNRFEAVLRAYTTAVHQSRLWHFLTLKICCVFELHNGQFSAAWVTLRYMDPTFENGEGGRGLKYFGMTTADRVNAGNYIEQTFNIGECNQIWGPDITATDERFSTLRSVS